MEIVISVKAACVVYTLAMKSKKFFIFLAGTTAILTFLITYRILITEDEQLQRYTLRHILGTRKDNTTPIKISNYTGNIPDVYIKDPTKKIKYNTTCGKFPEFFDLRFKNDHWQMQTTSNGTLHLYNAYVDTRNGTVVRIVSIYDVYRPNVHFYCQFWYDSKIAKIVRSEVPYWIFRPKWGADKGYLHHPYLITCPLDNGEIPSSVSLVENSCDVATNNLKLFNPRGEKSKNFVVCVKGLSFPYADLSVRLTEWIELVRILGADKINFYEFSVHPNAQKVLDHYVDEGLVEVTPITLVGDYSNQPLFQDKFLHKKVVQRRLQEVIPYNDCLYKHLQEYKYVVLLDTDEVIVPSENTWIELISTLRKQLPDVTSFMARNVYFFDNKNHQHEWFAGIPRYMHMLQHVYRAWNYTKPGHFVKGFHDTNKVAVLHNHFPFLCLYKGCTSKEIDIEVAHLQHYRGDCAAGASGCQMMKNNSVIDTRVWNFKSELIANVQRTLTTLDLLGDK